MLSHWRPDGLHYTMTPTYGTFHALNPVMRPFGYLLQMIVEQMLKTEENVHVVLFSSVEDPYLVRPHLGYTLFTPCLEGKGILRKSGLD